MSYIETIPPASANGSVRAMYERQLDHWGYVPNYAKVFCYRPEIMELWANLLAGIRKHIEPRRFELVTFAAAQVLGNTSCCLAHGKALTKFFSDTDVRKIAGGDYPESLSGAEIAMIKYARKVAKDATSVTAEDVAALRKQGFSNGEIFDIAATAAGRSFFTKILDSLGATPDTGLLQMVAELQDSLCPELSLERCA